MVEFPSWEGLGVGSVGQWAGDRSAGKRVMAEFPSWEGLGVGR